MIRALLTKGRLSKAFAQVYTLKGLKTGGSVSREIIARMCSNSSTVSEPVYNYETLAVTSPKEYVLQVELNRPEKRNALNVTAWREIAECFHKISDDPNCRAVILTGAGKIFTAGIDLTDLAGTFFNMDGDTARKAHRVRGIIQRFQESFSAVESCSKPVIAAIHSACVGGGVDMVTACDIRICSADAWFQIKEVDLGLAADVGTLQRLPKIVGNDSLVRELCYTARRFMADEAKEFGVVSRIYPDRDSLVTAAVELACRISKMSPIAVTGTKHNLNYSRDHTVRESLEYMATWNMAMLQTDDIIKAVQSAMNKEEPVFSKL